MISSKWNDIQTKARSKEVWRGAETEKESKQPREMQKYYSSPSKQPSSSYETTERQYCQLCAALLYTHVYIHAYIRKMTITTIQTRDGNKRIPAISLSHTPKEVKGAQTQKEETTRHTSAEGREEGEKTDLAVMNQSSACCLQSTRVLI